MLVGQERIAGGLCQALIINSANANAFTGRRGYRDSLEVADALSRRLGIDESLVIPSSTGVTGERLRVGKIKKSIPRLIRGLGEDNVRDAAEAIMTTDSFPKWRVKAVRGGRKDRHRLGHRQGGGDDMSRHGYHALFRDDGC